jgi:hypothetical protein
MRIPKVLPTVITLLQQACPICEHPPRRLSRCPESVSYDGGAPVQALVRIPDDLSDAGAYSGLPRAALGTPPSGVADQAPPGCIAQRPSRNGTRSGVIPGCWRFRGVSPGKSRESTLTSYRASRCSPRPTNTSRGAGGQASPNRSNRLTSTKCETRRTA